MLKESWKAFMVMNFIAPKLSVEIVVGQGPVVRLHRTDRRKLVTISLSSSLDKNTVPLSTCSEC